jgi:exopolysaccharide biosynthesis predicted pyruvyltransferase EpsI
MWRTYSNPDPYGTISVQYEIKTESRFKTQKIYFLCRNDKENNDASGRREYQLADVFPSINNTEGKGTLICHRKKSSRKSGYGEPDYDDAEVDNKTLPSQKAIQRNRTKSIKVSQIK